MNLEDIKSRSDLTSNEILALMDNEKNVDMYKKLSYFKFKADGYSSKESYKLANIKKSTAYYLENKWESGGYNALLPKYNSGRKSKLNKKQMSELEKELDKKAQWHPNEIITIMKDKWDITYTYSGVKKLIKGNFDITLVNSYDITREKNDKMPDFIENLDDINVNDEDKKEIKEIITRISKEKSTFVIKKLFYLLLIKIGFSNKIASSLLDVTPKTGKNWKQQWEENAYENLKRKKGQGRKKKISDENSLKVKKKLSKRDDWTIDEIDQMIKETTGKTYSRNYLYTFLRTEYNAKFSKPYPRDYRQSPYYKQSFNLKVLAKLRRYQLLYNPETNTIKNIKTGEPFLIFSFDESSNQFNTNNTKLWSLFKPMIERITDRFKCKVAGSYSLTSDGNDDLYLTENSTKETIIKCLESLRKKNPVGTIMLLIDNFSSHKATVVKEKAKELDIILCYLPEYSPQLQPIERIWKDIKKSYIRIQNY